jgi:hypothetical protein
MDYAKRQPLVPKTREAAMDIPHVVNDSGYVELCVGHRELSEEIAEDYQISVSQERLAINF